MKFIENNLTKLGDNAREILQDRVGYTVTIDDLQYYSWPATFSSTTGPWGGIGGQQVSSYQIHAFVLNGANAVCYCAGKIKYVKNISVLSNWDSLER